ncbi:hypothetical protein KBZ21_15370 [Streptomyces sp. A73]|nr:hypothetical protein [Streptomyces sp. A73]
MLVSADPRWATPKRVAGAEATGQHGDMIQIRTASSDDAALLASLNQIVHDLHNRHRPDLFLVFPELVI